MDINMPIMDGLESCQKISNFLNQGQDKDKDSHPMIFAVTGDDSVSMRETIKRYPFQGMFTNIVEAELSQIVRLV